MHFMFMYHVPWSEGMIMIVFCPYPLFKGGIVVFLSTLGIVGGAGLFLVHHIRNGGAGQF